ncbi:MAG: hypothetical protein ACREQ1_15890, partial [Woeseiaceae bacterium]
LYEQPLQKAADAFHALLPVVPDQGEETVEARRQPAQLPPVQVGHREGVLEFLRLVQITGAAQVIEAQHRRDFA